MWNRIKKNNTEEEIEDNKSKSNLQAHYDGVALLCSIELGNSYNKFIAFCDKVSGTEFLLEACQDLEGITRLLTLLLLKQIIGDSFRLYEVHRFMGFYENLFVSWSQ